MMTSRENDLLTRVLDPCSTPSVADQRFSLKQWFAGGAQSRGLRKFGCGHCCLRFFRFLLLRYSFILMLFINCGFLSLC